jgi:hypothetical protein
MELIKFHRPPNDFLWWKRICAAIGKSFLLLGVVVLVGLGCKEYCTDCGGWPRPDPPEVGEITIDIGQDTLRFLPGDSVSTPITIIVSDQYGNVLPWVKVSIALSNPQLGFIEYADTELRDTTNALGRVNLIFTAIGTAGDNVLSATTGGITRTREIFIRQQEIDIGSISVTADPDTVYLVPGDTVATQVCVGIQDISGNPIVGLTLPFAATGGRLAPLPATNELGQACTDWYFNDDTETGVYCFTIHLNQLSDSVCVTVLSPLDSLRSSSTSAFN